MNISNGVVSLSTCPPADANGNGEVGIGEVQLCINSFLSGCRSGPAPTSTPGAMTTPLPTTCVGDCGHAGVVTIVDLVTMVNIALSNASIAACSAGDVDGDGQVAVDEIVMAVANALGGC